jgi:hypothetical protein
MVILLDEVGSQHGEPKDCAEPVVGKFRHSSPDVVGSAGGHRWPVVIAVWGRLLPIAASSIPESTT